MLQISQPPFDIGIEQAGLVALFFNVSLQIENIL